MKLMIASLIVFLASQTAFSMDLVELATLNSEKIMERAIPELKNLKWEVGEYQERRIKKGNLKVGDLRTWVDREEGKAIWVNNELKILFQKKKLIEVLMERKSGKVLKYIEDGEEKTPPESSFEDCKDLGEMAETVTVPAGKYKSTRTILRCPEETLALWVNEGDINMNGQVRQAVLTAEENPNKFEYLVELTKFGKM